MNDCETLLSLLHNNQVHMSVTVLPTGCALDDLDSSAFAVLVVRPSDDGWEVRRNGELLSSYGKWECDDYPEPQHRQFTLAAAVKAAQTAVDAIKVNGRTFAQWNAA